ncbi:hypothetical protein [Spiroplasma sp. Moj]|uniref:hypothetical protein n=1 Tax=Spiroplasma sp. Moj TaxID=1922342 RepID=UPI0039EFABA6|nr:hypothetical protein [Spiroplasma sp. Moj]
MNITESIKFDKLQEENEALKKELSEKDKEINNLKFDNNMAKNYINKLESKQLYKENFTKEKILQGFDFRRGLVDTFTDGYVLKNSSIYNKLDRKEVK